MKKTNILSLVIAAALIAISSPSFAAGPPPGYLALKGGVYSPSDSHDIRDFNNGDSSRLDSKTGFAGEIAVGQYISPVFAVELGAGYFQSKGSPAAEPGETRLKVIPVIATGKLFLPLGSLEPYGLFGIGAYFTDFEARDNTDNFRGSSDVTYGLHAGGGVNLHLSPTMYLGAEGKYIWAEPSFGGQHVNLDGFITTAVLGFRF